MDKYRYAIVCMVKKEINTAHNTGLAKVASRGFEAVVKRSRELSGLCFLTILFSG